jgi:hypothetical protein
MIAIGDRLTLLARDEPLGELEMTYVDQPWFNCSFAPTEAFSKFLPLFAEEQRLLLLEQFEEWEAAYDRIMARGLMLIHEPSGNRIDDFLLHVEDRVARFRY